MASSLPLSICVTTPTHVQRKTSQRVTAEPSKCLSSESKLSIPLSHAMKSSKGNVIPTGKPEATMEVAALGRPGKYWPCGRHGAGSWRSIKSLSAAAQTLWCAPKAKPSRQPKHMTKASDLQAQRRDYSLLPRTDTIIIREQARSNSSALLRAD